jgi:SAM-dependent methyltransferase
MIKEKSIHELLCCPCHLHNDLNVNLLGELSCQAEHCALNQQKFMYVSGQPVLVDFQQSIFREADYSKLKDGSVLNRQRSPFHRFLRNIMWGQNRVTQINARIFIDKLNDVSTHPVLLIVGGGTKGVGSDYLYVQDHIRVISFDVYASELTDFIADAHSIPIKTSSIDGVWIQAVLEHVLDPTKVAAEIHRVLKPNGIVYAETPFVQQVHEKAYDFTRFTESGHRWLFRNFALIDSGPAAGPGMVLVWSIRYLFAGLFRSKKVGLLLGALFFWLRFLDWVIPQNYASDGAAGVFFMGLKSEQPIHQRDMINFFQGVL